MDPRLPLPARLFGAAFGLLFLGIGLTVLVFLWSASGFGAPPLFFRLFGSFIALGFVLVGGFSAYGMLSGKGPTSMHRRISRRIHLSHRRRPCENCGADFEAKGEEGELPECPFCGTLQVGES